MWGVSTVFLFLAIGLVSALDVSSTTSSPIIITNATTTASPNVTTPSVNATTTTAPPPKTNSTVMPTNSTTNSTTVPTTPTNSTTKPTSKPTSKPTEKPTTPAPVAGDYSVKNRAGNYCILAQMNATFVVTYTKAVSVNKTNQAQVPVTIPFKGFDTSGSSCSGNPILNIKWPNYDFTLSFEKDPDNKTWHISSLKFIVNTTGNKAFPNATDVMIDIQITNATELHGISGGLYGYYSCSPDHTYPTDNKKATLYLTNVKLQPFVKESSKEEKFGEEFNCEPTSPTKKPKDNNIVPIAVGCALAGLVLIVLIAYIIGRRKTQRGYEKV